MNMMMGSGGVGMMGGYGKSGERRKEIGRKWFVYLVRCRDESLYTGVSTDVVGRVKVHNQGQGAKYTRSRLPVELVYVEEYEGRMDAAKRECEIKKLSRKQKIILINELRGV